MSLDVNELAKAENTEVRENGDLVARIWYAEANGVKIRLLIKDVDAVFWVSPIWNMRQQGVALVDSSGQMVKNERRDR